MLSEWIDQEITQQICKMHLKYIAEVIMENSLSKVFPECPNEDVAERFGDIINIMHYGIRMPQDDVALYEVWNYLSEDARREIFFKIVDLDLEKNDGRASIIDLIIEEISSDIRGFSKNSARDGFYKFWAGLDRKYIFMCIGWLSHIKENNLACGVFCDEELYERCIKNLNRVISGDLPVRVISL